MSARLTVVGLGLCAAALSACGAKDPVYFTPVPAAIEVDPENMVAALVSTVQVPVRVEDSQEMEDRLALAMELGLDPAQVPQARRDDYAIEIEWTIKNLAAEDGIATISIVGANEYFLFDPNQFVVDPEEDETPPPLLGGIPIVVPALGQISGVFREDQISEAAQDWDAISRGGVVPQYALLTQWESKDVEGGMGGVLPEIPSAAVAALIRFDVSFDADQHMVLEYVLRVRDKDDNLEPCTMASIMDGTCEATLVPPSTAVFVPPPPPMM
jgi:hypothetical protein